MEPEKNKRGIAGSLLLISAVVLLLTLGVIDALTHKTRSRSTEYTGYGTFTGASLNLPSPCAESRADEVEILLALAHHDSDAVAGLSTRRGIPTLSVGTIVDGVYGGALAYILPARFPAAGSK